MAAEAGLGQIGKVAIEVRVDGTHNVRVVVIALAAARIARAGRWVGQIEATVDNEQICVVESRGEIGGGNQRQAIHGKAISRRCTKLSSIAAVAPQMRWPAYQNSWMSRSLPW